MPIQIQSSSIDPDIFALLAFLITALWFLLHVLCMVGTHRDATEYQGEHGTTIMLTPVIWSLCALLLGPFGLGLYWAMHRSTLNPARLSER